MNKTLLILFICLAFTGILSAHSYFIGFSGSPTSNGTCTRSCHLQNSFTPTCEISGFPGSYAPTEQYTIIVTHNEGHPISQFNCSVRSDLTSGISGLITEGEATSVYSTANESNGVHWSEVNTDSGTFIWTAPDSGTGSVTLYWAGLQGSRAFGADQQIVYHASESSTNIDYFPTLPEKFVLKQNYPNPFNDATTIEFLISQPGNIVLEIANILGHRVYQYTVPDALPGQYEIDWDSKNSKGVSLPSGLYFYQLRTPEGNLTRKMALLR